MAKPLRLDKPAPLIESSPMRFAAIILAAGSGSRAGAGPKQWRLLAGRPVLRWSAEALSAAGARPLVVVVPEGDLELAAEILEGLSHVRLVAGGAERADSAKAGLAAVDEGEAEAVLIHDAARPLVNASHIRLLLEALADADGAVPALPVADTLKRMEGRSLVTVPREGLWRAQTPQAFRLAAILSAFAQLQHGEPATDDARVLELASGKVVAVAGDPLLMKLTCPEDFAMAERLLSSARSTLVGQGYDVHAFGEGDAVWLCGVRIAHGRALVGHSDADAGLHAVTDAVLGAIAAGDIGDHFPPEDPRWKGAPSDQFLRHAVGLAAAQGARLVNADVTLICESPRIKPHREAMRLRLAELLQLPPARVSVKATTTEGLGFTGRREGIAAQAIVSLEATTPGS